MKGDNSSERWRRAFRKIVSDRGSVFLEYALVTVMLMIVAVSVLNPGSLIYQNIGRDYWFRSIIMKLPFF